MGQAQFNGHSMVGALRRVMVCSPRNAGWETASSAGQWKTLGFNHEPNCNIAQTQHDGLRKILDDAGAEVVTLPGSVSLSLDAVYTHDSSFPTDSGLILMNPGKRNRIGEAQSHREFCHELGVPVFGEIRAPGTTEAGDMVWLDSKTLLIGHGYRTNVAGIRQMCEFLKPKMVEVLAAPLPHGAGPSAPNGNEEENQKCPAISTASS